MPSRWRTRSGTSIQRSTLAMSSAWTLATAKSSLSAGPGVERVIAAPLLAPACDLIGGRDAAPGDTVVNVSSRAGMNAPGAVLEIGVAPQQETIEIAGLSGPPLPAPNPGAVVLRAPLRFGHPRAAPGTVRTFGAPITPTNPATSPLETPAGAAAIAVNR